ncbi:MAG: signal peptidase I [Candidatus Bathyarchaeota archaeon]|nr:MAG: signal peptidase I [Candidatus Bathyarchaeota archaeon]
MPWVQSQFFISTFGPLRGSSMEPTIPEGSKGIADRFTYRWKDFVVGDIIIFTPPNNDYSNSENTACKRIIAVGGETLQVRDGDIYVDGQERNLSIRAHRDAYPGSSPPIDFISRDNPYLTYGVDEPYKVPGNQYFVLGDNSRYSIDSRCYGAIPRENILGRVIKIYWPPRRIGIVR